MAAVKEFQLLVYQLQRWYQQNARALPWRRHDGGCDPYHVLVSEIMLQQTTVATVKERYQQFIERFPTVASLAAAPQDEVLAEWSGLGYYNRARNLQAAAREIVEKFQGEFPRTHQDVLALPGVGAYTAGAVCSLAFEQPQPIVDANVARVLSRLLALEEPLKSTSTQKILWEKAGELVLLADNEKICPSVLNSALMELGALVCSARDPKCGICPVSKFCSAYQRGVVEKIPLLPPKKQYVQLRDVCLYITDDSDAAKPKVLLERCTANAGKKWWRDMWQLPRLTLQEGESTDDAAQRLLHQHLKLEGQVGSQLHKMRHTVTHHKIELYCFEATVAVLPDESTLHWHALDDLVELPLPSVMSKMLAKLIDQAAVKQLVLEMEK